MSKKDNRSKHCPDLPEWKGWAKDEKTLVQPRLGLDPFKESKCPKKKNHSMSKSKKNHDFY